MLCCILYTDSTIYIVTTCKIGGFIVVIVFWYSRLNNCFYVLDFYLCILSCILTYKTVHLDAVSDVWGGERRLAFHVKVGGPWSRQGFAGPRSLYTGDHWLLASYWVKLVTWSHLLPSGIKAAAVVWPVRFKLAVDVSTLNKSAIHLFTIGLVLF